MNIETWITLKSKSKSVIGLVFFLTRGCIFHQGEVHALLEYKKTHQNKKVREYIFGLAVAQSKTIFF